MAVMTGRFQQGFNVRLEEGFGRSVILGREAKMGHHQEEQGGGADLGNA